MTLTENIEIRRLAYFTLTFTENRFNGSGLITDVFRSVCLLAWWKNSWIFYNIPDSHLSFCQLPTPSMHSV